MAKFQRRNPDPSGKYHLVYKMTTDEAGEPKIGREIVIEGREVFETDDKRLIEVMRKDEEIEEVRENTTIEPKEKE
jgi:hypothetical protein